MTIKAGEKLPSATFIFMSEDGPDKITTEEFFAGKKVVLFAVPGAFTRTCHGSHLPGYLDHLEELKAKGVDEVAVVSVNDVWVMNEWAKASNAVGKIHFLCDGALEFTSTVGMEEDRSASGMGMRSKRYAMIVEDGVVKTLNIEEVNGVVEGSGAEAILTQL